MLHFFAEFLFHCVVRGFFALLSPRLKEKTVPGGVATHYFRQRAILLQEHPTGPCDLFSSRFAGEAVGRSAEAWPVYEAMGPHTKAPEEVPLFFLGQINVGELPFVPESLKGLALISIFVDPEFRNPERCLVRAYESIDGLVALPAPLGVTPRAPCAMDFEMCEDAPCVRDPALADFSEGVRELVSSHHVLASKIGCYVSFFQDPPLGYLENHPAKPKFCLQLFAIEGLKVGWVDAGAFYLARGTAPGHTHEWFCDIQFH
ncbi:MAG: hypothetical protein C0514_07680 [Candidatus Puniceispirillum sp.]|nr:hypothetical protein [Candidatus Puniceispirillum sp.]